MQNNLLVARSVKFQLRLHHGKDDEPESCGGISSNLSSDSFFFLAESNSSPILHRENKLLVVVLLCSSIIVVVESPSWPTRLHLLHDSPLHRAPQPRDLLVTASSVVNHLRITPSRSAPPP
uniref:Uncharacterized protein n=1 Tax=Brassica oleracea var. oleracea TaxID=109376 RepID=A0A0D3AXP3_BRAOL